jgi:hypothetical protein
MRKLLSWLAVLTVLGCSAKQPQPGWEYQPAQGAHAARLFYRFDDGQETTLIGSCEGEPQFMIAGGGWEAPQFTLTVDDRSWRFPTREGEHGHYLPVDLYVASQAIAQAKRRIVFQAGNWRRALQPAPPLTSFVASCS